MMDRDVVLSDRLLAVVNMVTKGNIVCDVGCDHGFVSIYLVQNEISKQVIAMDVNAGPLKAAKEHIDDHGLTSYIETRLSDGVSALAKGEAHTLICAGMGGKLIKQILEAGSDKVRVMNELILQPQSEIKGMREYLRKQGYLIVEENMIFEDGKYYPMMKVCLAKKHIDKQESNWQRIEDKYGPILLKQKNSVLYRFLQRERHIYENILCDLKAADSRQEARRREIMDQIEDIDTAFSYIVRKER